MNSLRIASPLTACVIPPDGKLSFFKTLGLITDLARYHQRYSQYTVNELTARILPAITQGKVNIFFDDQFKPLAFATWVALDEQHHQSLLDGDTGILENHEILFTSNHGPKLWIRDFASPFSNLLFAINHLKTSLPSFDQAFVVRDQISNGSLTLRINQLW